MTLSELAKSNRGLACKLIGYMSNVQLPTPNDIHSEMPIINKMVKSELCPKNLKNRFYAFKHKYILRCLELGLVAKVVDLGKSYGFHMYNGEKYSQSKTYFRNGLNGYWEGKIEVVDDLETNEAIDFDENAFNRITIKIILWLYTTKKAE